MALICAVAVLKLRPAQSDESVTADPFWLSVQLTVPTLFELVATVCGKKLLPTMAEKFDDAETVIAGKTFTVKGEAMALIPLSVAVAVIT